MPYFDLAPGERVLRKFTVLRHSNGRPVAAEALGLRGGVFGSRNEALCSALWQSDGDPSRGHVEAARHSTAHVEPAVAGK